MPSRRLPATLPAPAVPAVPAVPPPAPSAEARRAAEQVLNVLPRVMDAMRQAMRAQLDGPLTVPQFRCLAFIHRQPGSSLSAVAGLLGVTLATASAMVDRLVRAGHLQAQVDPADRRRTVLNLCDSGQAVLERVHRQTGDVLARALAGRSAPELLALHEGLRVLDAAFDHVEKSPL